MRPNPLTLAQEFPSLRGIAQESDEWLGHTKTMSIFEQFDSREIEEIKFPILPKEQKSLLTIHQGYFYVYINRHSEPHSFMELLCREIGHTFKFGLHPIRKKRRIGGQLFEEFLDEFARKLMAINTKEKIETDYHAQEDDIFAFILLQLSNARKMGRVIVH